MTIPDLTCLAPAMRDAGAAIMQIKSAGVTADYKADASPVTAADHASEAILKVALEQLFPDIAVISEENASSHLLHPQDRYFLVDPLDGTREFLRPDSNGNFTVNIGLIEKGAACGGLIYVPSMDWLCWTDTDGQPHRYGKPGWKNSAFIACAGYQPRFPLSCL